MSMDPPPHVPRAGRSRFRTVAVRLLRLPVPFEDMRVVDVVVLPIAVVIAIAVAIPILIITTVAAYALFTALTAVGVAQATASVVIPVLGFGGGLVTVAVVLLRISRRLPSAIRSLVYEDPEEHALRPQAGDPDADPTTFVERVRAADTTLSAEQSRTAAAERPDDLTNDDAPPS